MAPLRFSCGPMSHIWYKAHLAQRKVVLQRYVLDNRAGLLLGVLMNRNTIFSCAVKRFCGK